MGSIIRPRVTVVFALVTLATAVACAGDPETSEMQAGLDELVANEIADRDFISTGVSVRLADGRLLRAQAGHASPEETTAYDVTTTEQIVGSATKLYTAVLVMQLVEEGQIALDTTIDRWFSFAGADEITVRMLLNHTSGLNDYLGLLTLEQFGRPWSPAALVETAIEAGPLGEPGMAQAIYSNTNYVVLAMIVEAETGRSWEENIDARISRPLALDHTYYAGERERAGALVGGYLEVEGEWLNTLTLFDASVGWGMGAMVTTNAELLRFTEALFDGELFASPDTLAQMLRFDTEANPEYLGDGPPSTLGLAVTRMELDGIVFDGHLGHIEGYNSAALRDTETGAIIVVTSNDNRAFSGATAARVAEYVREREGR